MTTVVTTPTLGPGDPPEPARQVTSAAGAADRIFGLSLRGAGIAVLLIMGAVGLFLSPGAQVQSPIPA